MISEKIFFRLTLCLDLYLAFRFYQSVTDPSDHSQNFVGHDGNLRRSWLPLLLKPPPVRRSGGGEIYGWTRRGGPEKWQESARGPRGCREKTRGGARGGKKTPRRSGGRHRPAHKETISFLAKKKLFFLAKKKIFFLAKKKIFLSLIHI